MPYANASDRREFDKRRNARADVKAAKAACERKRQKELPLRREFVAIDSEGGNAGEVIEYDGRRFQPHKTFLWGAARENGDAHWLFTGKSLTSIDICEWLLGLPAKFGNQIFVMFAMSYDITQALAGLPFDKAWEVSKNKPFRGEASRAGERRLVLWRQYGFQYLKGKAFTLYEFNEGPMYLRTGARNKLNVKRRITIFDVFGFFQSSFVKASRAMPGAITETELEIIKKGKSERGSFDIANVNEIKRYTTAELHVLARMMTRLRDAMRSEKIEVRAWHGAGSIAQALLAREGTRNSLHKIESENITVWQRWAHHAYFGGRIELLRQGSTRQKLFSYDIASAYPAAATLLPAMDGGFWTIIDKPSIEDIKNSSPVSMVHVKTRGLNRKAPFFPLPYRVPKKLSILFPQDVNGYYMRDEVLAAFEWKEAISPNRGEIETVEMWRFIPDPNKEKPFHFLRELFDYRATLPKTDVREKVIKLGINSVYGKLAQRIGGAGKPPAHASPWHAAAITAWTRAQLIRACLQAPDDIVMLATDGIVSRRELILDVPARKTLGAWEAAELPNGGVFCQSGVYAISAENGAWYAKSRGFRPNNVGGDLVSFVRDTIPPLWRDGVGQFDIPYTNYITLGAATASVDLWRFAGTWANGVRSLDLNSAGVKRDVPEAIGLRRARSNSLIATSPNCSNILLCDEAGELMLSAPSEPDWLHERMGLDDDDEQETLDARFAPE